MNDHNCQTCTFARHLYDNGGDDEYKNLRRDLLDKIEIPVGNEIYCQQEGWQCIQWSQPDCPYYQLGTPRRYDPKEAIGDPGQKRLAEIRGGIDQRQTELQENYSRRRYTYNGYKYIYALAKLDAQDRSLYWQERRFDGGGFVTDYRVASRFTYAEAVERQQTRPELIITDLRHFIHSIRTGE